MMNRTLRESLADYDLVMLNALAELRGALLSSNHPASAAGELADQLLAPASLAIALTDLSPAEGAALASLQRAGGWLDHRRFAHRFGAIRLMGAGRLAREQPWRAPANPAEGLWYRGLVFRGFRQGPTGVVEVAYIPTDVLAALPAPLPPAAPTELPRQPEPPCACLARTDLVEDVFGALVHIRNHLVRRNPAGSLSSGDLGAINRLCVEPVLDDERSKRRLEWLVHLCHAARLCIAGQGRLSVQRAATTAWLQAPPPRQLLELQLAWLADQDWNDLEHVPSLRLRPGGAKNDPRLVRRVVLRQLGSCRPGTWYAIADLVAAIRSDDPDFQRPDGDYASWQISDVSGRPLDDFEHWDEVEGALIRHLVSGPLHWLGVVDVGCPAPAEPPTAFRLAETGLELLQLPTPAGGQPPGSLPPPASLTVDADFGVRVSPQASLYDRFQLARFAHFVGRQSGWACYRITPASLALARRQDVSCQQIVAFLNRLTAGQVPAAVLDALRQGRAGRPVARLERAVLLRLEQPQLLTRLQAEPQLAPLLGEAVGSQAVLIPSANLAAVRSWLAEHGYL
jgi:hypothetical protein